MHNRSNCIMLFNISLGHVTILPYKVGMLGGRNVMIRGPCFGAKEIRCKCKVEYGQETHGEYSYGVLIDSEEEGAYARCTIPLAYVIGKAKLFLSLDDGNTFPYDGTFYYGKIARHFEFMIHEFILSTLQRI